MIELRLDKEWKLWKKLIEENKIGNPVRYFLYPKSSGNKIHQVYHLKKYKDFSKIDFKNSIMLLNLVVVMEIWQQFSLKLTQN